ncbi:cupin domain-containing protein [Paraclostridium bifermentans]|nr:cupin domain-containing protein [Paraclostridium bifermentans]
MSLSPGSVSSSENIQHKGYEIAYLLEGEVDLYLDDEKFTLYQGDSVKTPAGVKHRWENKSNSNAKVIFCCYTLIS